MTCEFCLLDAALINQNWPCCQLRLLANAPPHVIRAAETATARRGDAALRQFQQQINTEKQRLARIRHSRQRAVANLSLYHITQVLNDKEP
jgi:hypothetical protein